MVVPAYGSCDLRVNLIFSGGTPDIMTSYELPGVASMILGNLDVLLWQV